MTAKLTAKDNIYGIKPDTSSCFAGFIGLMQGFSQPFIYKECRLVCMYRFLIHRSSCFLPKTWDAALGLLGLQK